MNLFAGLEKFGFSGKDDMDIMDDGKKKSSKSKEPVAKEVKEVTEEDLLLNKTIQCPVCDGRFQALMVKTAKLKRQEPDFDLRPNFAGIDTVKYDVTACPNCGYAAMNRYFESLSVGQKKLIRTEVCAKYRPVKPVPCTTYSYDQAIERFKISLVSTMVKRAKLSEKSYTCLKISWLMREKLKEMPNKTEEDKAARKEVTQEMVGFYKQAYEGFMKVASTETPPFCGMDSNTLDFMLANMSFYFKQYDTAGKLVSRLLGGSGVPSRVKDKCLDLKDKIVAAKKAQEEKAAAAAAKKAAKPADK
ncbi:MAG: DUF2225 domain-containing protein [Lachnospiraceae bacterium]|nr:DUF2225 domain-containing protein [Lachnospiraceae bacterium]